MNALKTKIAPDFSDGVDRKQLKLIRDRFLSVNQGRFDLALNALSFRHQDILRVLPLLYQVNHALLPGYVAQQTPYGVSGYEPDKDALSIAKSFSQTFKYRADRRHPSDIISLFMMGSTGTLAHSESSDVDLWLCVSPHLDEAAREQLQEKVDKIDAWANSQGLELHTFIMDSEQFRVGEGVSKVDEESSGSAQHFLLLDEFYRTAILLAGRYPIWWLIPPSYEADYTATVDMLLTKRFVKEADIIDFGSSSKIPQNELVGAGLWQLYKGLDAPYKSVLKILLAEVYAQELPVKPTLSMVFKQSVYDDLLALDQLDPYTSIYHRLADYLTERQELKRLDLVRKSLYIKIGKKLSKQSTAKRPSWQVKTLQTLVKDWAWGDEQFRYLDERVQWKFDQVISERQELVAELTNSYRFLSNFARANQIQSSITAEDLNILGRKLYAVFQRKAGKVEQINPGIAPNLWEENLAIHHSSAQSYGMSGKFWLLYRDLPSPQDAPFHPVLKKSSSLIDLLAWLHFNGVINKNTRLSLVAGESGVSLNEVRQLIQVLENNIPYPLPYVSQESFYKTSVVKKLVLLLNVGLDPLGAFTEKGINPLSDRTDSLSFSSQRINLVRTVDQVALNSWNELSAHCFAQGGTLMQNLQAYLQLCYDQMGEAECELAVHCFSPQRGEVIAQRVRDLFYDVKRAFFPAQDSFVPVRYLIEVGNEFYLLSHIEGQFRFLESKSREHLVDTLLQPQKQFSPVVLDQNALTDQSLLKGVLKYNLADTLQFFYKVERDHVDLVILDEVGSVLTLYLVQEDEHAFLSAWQHFVQSTLDKRAFSASLERTVANIDYGFYRVQRNVSGDYDIAKIKKIPDLEAYELNVRVLDSETGAGFDLSLLHHDFTQAEYGNRQVAAMLHFLKHQEHYDKNKPVKIVDIAYPVETTMLNVHSQTNLLSIFALYFQIQDQIQRS